MEIRVPLECLARELACQRSAPAEPEQYDAVLRRRIHIVKVLGRLIQDSPCVPPARREGVVDDLSHLRDEPSDEGDGLSIFPRPDSVVVAGLLGFPVRRLRRGPVFYEPSAHEHVQLQDVAHAFVLLEAGRVMRLVAGAVEAEYQCAC